MRVLGLKLVGVRNLEPLNLEPGPGFNVLSGANGQGKTNFIEAIYAVCTLRSFRTSRLADLIALGGTQAKISARIDTGEMTRIFELELRERGRTPRIDGKMVRPVRDYFGHFNVVLFAPEDLLVVRGSPDKRRKFLDRAVFSRGADFLALSQQYDKVLRQRNQLLRNLQAETITWDKAAPLLEVYDQQLAAAGADITVRRVELLSALAPRAASAFESIMQAGLPMAVEYQAKPEVLEALANPTSLQRDQVREALAGLLHGRRTLDRKRATTSIGPHRDDLLFTLAEQPAATFASQGQTRAMVLAWKTALLELLRELRGEPPLLLLDDVSSELDPARNEYLFAFLSGLAAQCFITTTHPDFVLLDRRGPARLDLGVEAGRITPL